MRNFNEVINYLWPLVAALSYQWFVLLAIFLVMLGLTIAQWVKWVRLKDSPEYQQSGGKKGVIKNTVIQLLVVPAITAILLGIIAGILTSIIKKEVGNMSGDGDEYFLNSNGTWKDMSYYVQNILPQDQVSLGSIKITLPVKVSKDGNTIENFKQIQEIFASFIKVA